MPKQKQSYTANQEFKDWFNSLSTHEQKQRKQTITNELLWDNNRWDNIIKSKSRLYYSEMVHISNVLGVPITSIFHHILTQVPIGNEKSYDFTNEEQTFISINTQYSDSLLCLLNYFNTVGWTLRANFHSWKLDTCAVIKLLEAAKMLFVKAKVAAIDVSVQNELLAKIDRLENIITNVRTFYNSER